MGALRDSIPQQLQDLHRWVCSNKDSKRPMRAFEAKPASTTKPSTWASFEEAESCVENGTYEYVGFVFDNDGYIGIDIDHGIDEDGFPTDEALEIINACKSYTEVSKSGKGFHIICEGELPITGSNNRKGWEIYREGRFFVLTGQTVMYSDIQNAQEGIDLALSKHFSDDIPKADTPKGDKKRIWAPTYSMRDGKISLPTFDTVSPGSRHICMVSFCGQFWTALAHKNTVLRMARAVNERYMSPPLEDNEIRQIVESVTRYRR